MLAHFVESRRLSREEMDELRALLENGLSKGKRP
jgi:predicted transcriptional regulator